MPKIIGIEDGSISSNYTLQQKDKILTPRKAWKNRYYVLADNAGQGEDTIYSQSGVPRLFQSLGGALCKGVKAKEKSTVFRHPNTGVKTILWTVDCSFDTDVDSDLESDSQSFTPTDLTPTVRWSGETEEEVLEQDPITGDPVQTAAEEPLIITTPIVLPVLEITRYESYPFDPNTMLAYAHRTNSTTFWGAPPGCALMMPMGVDEEVVNQIRYCKVTYRIKFKIKVEGGTIMQDPWKARVLHHGYKYRETAGGEPRTYQDKLGNPATVNLAEDGTKLPTDDPAEYLSFNRFTKANFNNLLLGPF